MFSKIISALAGLKKWIIVGLIAALSIVYGLLSASKNKLARRDKQDAEAQRDVLIRAEENRRKASQEGKQRAKDALDRADDGDWSGFN